MSYSIDGLRAKAYSDPFTESVPSFSRVEAITLIEKIDDLNSQLKEANKLANKLNKKSPADAINYLMNRCVEEIDRTEQAQAALQAVSGAQKMAERCVEEAEAERDRLRAARFAYATEFPLGSDGEPDVGSIHQNIRKLKVKCDKLRESLSEAVKILELAYEWLGGEPIDTAGFKSFSNVENKVSSFLEKIQTEIANTNV